MKIHLFPNDEKTPQQALLEMLNDVDRHGIKNMLIIASNDEEIFISASEMQNKDVLWLCASAALHALEVHHGE